jgi:hypothetical protein
MHTSMIHTNLANEQAGRAVPPHSSTTSSPYFTRHFSAAGRRVFAVQCLAALRDSKGTKASQSQQPSPSGYPTLFTGAAAGVTRMIATLISTFGRPPAGLLQVASGISLPGRGPPPRPLPVARAHSTDQERLNGLSTNLHARGPSTLYSSQTGAHERAALCRARTRNPRWEPPGVGGPSPSAT